MNEAEATSSDASGAALICGVILLRPNGDALFQLRDDKPGLSEAGRWVFPGGHREAEESDRDGARREFREETGYDCTSLQWLSTTYQPFSHKAGRYRLTVFWSVYDEQQPIHCYEGQEVRFLQRDSAPRFPIPGYQLGLWDQAVDAMNHARANGTEGGCVSP